MLRIDSDRAVPTGALDPKGHFSSAAGQQRIFTGTASRSQDNLETRPCVGMCSIGYAIDISQSPVSFEAIWYLSAGGCSDQMTQLFETLGLFEVASFPLEACEEVVIKDGPAEAAARSMTQPVTQKRGSLAHADWAARTISRVRSAAASRCLPRWP